MTKSLKFDQVIIRLGAKTLLQLDAEIQPGEVLTIMGPSGSGKSTLLAFAGGFLDPAFSATGRIFSCGQDITQSQAALRRAGLLFQDPLLFPHMSVGGNIAFALPASIKGRKLRDKAVDDALTSVGLEDLVNHDPFTLSGGQKARVALARTLVSDPAFLLLDEPFSKLDTDLRDQMRRLVFDRAKKASVPVVLVTHDQQDAVAANGPIITIGNTIEP